MRQVKIILFSVVFIFGLQAQLFSQDSTKNDIDYLFDLELEELFNIEVSGSSRILKKSASNAPSHILIITKKQIQNRGYLSLIEVLEDLPGIKVDKLSDPRYLNDVTIRGLRYSDKFLILIDGVRVSSPTNEIMPIFENYPVHFAEQIEIIYGSSSALYGADAFSGVINIISRDPDEVNGTEVRIESGQYGYNAGNIIMGKKINRKTGFVISGQFMSDDQPHLSSFYPTDYAGGLQALQTGTFNTINGPISPKSRVIPLEEHRRAAYGIHARFNVDNFSVNYFGNYALIPSTTANKPTNAVYNRGTFLGQYINTGNVNYTGTYGKWTSTSYLVGSRYDLDPWSNFRNVFTVMEPAYLYSYSWKLKAEQIFNYEINEGANITAGVTAERFLSVPRSNDLEFPLSKFNPEEGIIAGTVIPEFPDGISAEIQKVRYDNYGVYIEYDQKILSNLNTTLGVRYDKNSRFGVTVNPRLGIVWKPQSNFSIKGIYGTAYLEPSPQYTFDQFGHLSYVDSLGTFTANFAQLPNPDLKPQTIQTLEAVIKYLINDQFSLGINTFYSSSNGLINPVSVNPSSQYTLQGFAVLNPQIYDNLGSQVNYGFNFQWDWQKRFNQYNSISLYGSYGYLEGNLDHDEDGLLIRNLPGISNHTLKTGVSLKLNKFTSSFRLIGMDEQRVININATKTDDPTKYQSLPGYIIANTYLDYQLDIFNIFLKIDNTFDNRYRSVNLGAAPVGNVKGSASAEFQNGAPQNPIRIIMGLKIRLD